MGGSEQTNPDRGRIHSQTVTDWAKNYRPAMDAHPHGRRAFRVVGEGAMDGSCGVQGAVRRG
jgi:hypothetical protein